MKDYSLSNLVLKSVFPNNEIIVDKFGNPSVMVFIPKFTMNQVINGGSNKVHPAFIVNGVERDGFYISKFLNTDVDGVGCSLPAGVPGSGGMEGSLDRCIIKGRGWHLTTIQEWGAVALWCKKNGHLPNGNSAYGRDARENVYKAIPVPRDDNKVGPTLTGTGPLSWSHDNTAGGIWDLAGNLSEWLGGFRAVYGEIQVMPNNDGADINNSHDPDSTAWRAIDAATGEFVIPDGKGTTKGTVKLDWDQGPVYDWAAKWVFSTEVKNRSMDTRRCNLSFVQCSDEIGPAAKELLIAYGLILDDPTFDSKGMFAYHCNGREETFIYRGGYWGSGTTAGVFKWSCSWGRGHDYEGNGYRASYIPLD